MLGSVVPVNTTHTPVVCEIDTLKDNSVMFTTKFGNYRYFYHEQNVGVISDLENYESTIRIQYNDWGRIIRTDLILVGK